MLAIIHNTLPTAVVPIFVNAGTALLPAIVAPIASALALLFKPRELFALAKRRPLVIPAVVGGVIGLTFLCIWVFSPATPARHRVRRRLTGPRWRWM